jgi:hypothetical protein
MGDPVYLHHNEYNKWWIFVRSYQCNDSIKLRIPNELKEFGEPANS